MFNQNIIAQPPTEGGEDDEIKCDSPPCPCDVWELTQNRSWVPPAINTTGRTIELGMNNIYYASQVFNPHQVISNRKIHIQGFFWIDIPLTFDNCEIIIDPSIVVFVSDNNDFTTVFKESYIHGNYALWYGFDVYEGETLKIKNCYIEDAYTAVFSRSGSTIRSVDTKYNRNLISIRAYNFNEEDYGEPQVILDENHFNCTTDILPQGPPVEAIFDIPWDKKSYAAIYSNNTDLSIAEFNCKYSSVGNHANGILSFGGDVTAQNYLFYNIEDSDEYEFPYEGYGIAIDLDQKMNFNSNGKFLNTNGWDDFESIEDPNFMNVDYPLTLIGGYLNTRFHRTDNSVTSVKGTRLTQAEIITNEFKNFSSKGVYWWDSRLPDRSEAEISLNYFRGETGSTGVHSNMNWGNIFQGFYYSYSIHTNDFSGNAITGIESMQDRTAKIYNNDYDNFSSDENTIGIRVSGGNDINTIENDIHSDLPPVNHGIGIQYVETDESLIRCNDVRYWGYGYNWAGTNHLQIHENDARLNYVNWHYEKASSTDPQYKTNNRWFPLTGFPVKAIHETKLYVPGGSVSRSKITVGSNTPSFSTDWHPGRPVNTDPTTLDAEDGNYNPERDCFQDKIFPIVLSEADSIVAIDSAQGTSFPFAYQWMQELDLYTKIKENQLTFSPPSVYYSFVQQCQNNNISDFYQAIQSFHEAFEYTSQQATNITSMQDDIKTSYSAISYYDSLYDENLISYPTLMQQRNSLFQTINTKKAALDQTLDTYQQERNNELSSVLASFQNISTHNYLAAEYKRAYQIYARYYLQQLTSQDSATIFSFDGACIEEYHKAAMIYQALSEAIGQKNDLVYGCNAPPQLRGESSENGIRLYPNPVRNSIKLEFDRKFSGNLKILNVNGQVVRIISCKNTRSQQLQLTDLQSGVYYVSAENGEFETVKFIKQ